MSEHRLWKGFMVTMILICFAGLAMGAAGENTVSIETSSESTTMETLFDEMSAVIDAADLSEEVRERLESHLAALYSVIAGNQENKAILAAVAEALEAADGEYRAFLAGVQVALETGTFGGQFATIATALAAEGTLGVTDSDMWRVLLSLAPVEVTA